MAIRLENIGIAVRDLEAAIALFTDLGLTLIGRDTIHGEWADTAVGLDGNHVNIAMLQTPGPTTLLLNGFRHELKSKGGNLGVVHLASVSVVEQCYPVLPGATGGSRDRRGIR